MSSNSLRRAQIQLEMRNLKVDNAKLRRRVRQLEARTGRRSQGYRVVLRIKRLWIIRWDKS
jgi:hypothetical protein